MSRGLGDVYKRQVSAPAQSAAPAEKQEEPPQKDAEDAMDALLAFGEQFDNVTIQ